MEKREWRQEREKCENEMVEGDDLFVRIGEHLLGTAQVFKPRASGRGKNAKTKWRGRIVKTKWPCVIGKPASEGRLLSQC
jgi:hypothetical protein